MTASDRGSVTVEVALWTPVAAVLVSLLWAFGRVDFASTAVEHVAMNAARMASHARSAAESRAAAVTAAHQVLAERGVKCRDTSIEVDTSGFSVPPGQPAQVAVEVACTVALADLGVPGLPGERTLRSKWASALDTFRARQP